MKKISPVKSRVTASQRARMLESLLYVTADFNYIFDRQGRFTYINQALLNLLGITTRQAIGRNFHDLKYPPDLATKLQAQIEQVFVTKNILKDETVFVNPEGKWGYYEYIFVPVKNKRGQVEAVAGSTRDISVHKQAQLALKASEERFKQLAETSNFGLVIGDTQGRLTYANATVQKLLGYSEDDFKTGGVRWDRLTPPEFAAKDARAVQQLTTSGHCEPYEKEYLAKDGRRIPILIGASKLTTSDNSEEVAVFLVDLSAKRLADQARDRSEKQLEALNRNLEKLVIERTEELHQKDLQLLQAQKLEAIGRLSGGVAHDFNNLITGIIGITQDVREALGADSPHANDLREVLEAAEKASALTRQLLAFGRRQITTPIVLDLNAIIRDMNKIFSRLLGEDIEVLMKLDPHLGAIKADQSQLEQLLINLMINARDAISGNGSIQIETTNVELGGAHSQGRFPVHPGPYICLTLTDSGSGMSDETLSHIFEPFFTTKPQGKGTGLGLATVYGIVNQNNGDIAVISELSKGTTFKIYLPRVSEIPDIERRKSVREVSPKGTESILVVEDEDIVRYVVVKALKKCGYSVLEARSGEEALKILDRLDKPIDLLITDVIMTGMNGHVLAQQANEKQPGIQILFMSGYTQDVMSERGIMQPGIQFIQKSFTAESFCRKVREVLDARPRVSPLS
jgi:PAS domain S-box-containing protein